MTLCKECRHAYWRHYNKEGEVKYDSQNRVVDPCHFHNSAYDCACPAFVWEKP